MKKLVLLIFAMALMASSSVSRAVDISEELTLADSTLCVSALFSDNDSADYWIYDDSWLIDGSDTIMLGHQGIKLRWQVADSTSRGYDIGCTIVDVDTTMAGSIVNRIANQVLLQLKGSSIDIRTDTLGQLVDISHLNEFGDFMYRKTKESVKSFKKTPEWKKASKDFFDWQLLAFGLYENLINEYMLDIAYMLTCNGKEFDYGKSISHIEATKYDFGKKVTHEVSFDEDRAVYSIYVCSECNLKESAVKKFLKDDFGMVVDKQLFKAFEADKKDSKRTMVVTYFAILNWDAWPVKQIIKTDMTVGKRRLIKQKKITCRSLSSREIGFKNYIPTRR